MARLMERPPPIFCSRISGRFSYKRTLYPRCARKIAHSEPTRPEPMMDTDFICSIFSQVPAQTQTPLQMCYTTAQVLCGLHQVRASQQSLLLFSVLHKCIYLLSQTSRRAGSPVG